ncbi:ran-binding protein 9-like isoform X2 [Camelus ferus]|uniref:Ran-binding protein 9-like isoform X2 n=1 Tax=Camelus ferus TaxID=419612 RepID=A0A8B8RII7_CAMFR|nr:ran-binding protein 9-like isoform X2 [Camelus ferus]
MLPGPGPAVVLVGCQDQSVAGCRLCGAWGEPAPPPTPPLRAAPPRPAAPPPRRASVAGPHTAGAPARASALRAGGGEARTPEPAQSVWKLGLSQVLLDQVPEEERGLGSAPLLAVASAAVAGQVLQRDYWESP